MCNVMVSLPNIGGALCASSVIPFLVYHAAKFGWRPLLECRAVKFCQVREPPKMYIQCTSPGDGQTSCKVWLASGERRRCSNESKTRNPLKFAGVPQTPEPNSAVSGPKYTFSGVLPPHIMEFWPVQNSLYAQVLRSPILSALLHGTAAAGLAKLCGVIHGMELWNFRRGCHLYSAGPPSRWASAHIVVCFCPASFWAVRFVITVSE